jgi:hypothetical protein
MKHTLQTIAVFCVVTFGIAIYADAGGKPAPAAATEYTALYTVRLSGFISKDALGPTLRALIGNKSNTPFTLVGQCPTSDGSPNGWGMINLTDVGKSVPLFFNISPAPPGSLPGLGMNGFAIAERLKAQQIIIDPQMTFLNLPTPALAFLAPATSDDSNWVGDIVNGDAAGFSAQVTEVSFKLQGKKPK